MNFRKVNNITGWAVFLIACITFIMTREARGSLWDCGEFVSSAYKMQLPHPPGAPMFTLLGRFFIILFGDNSATAANAVNFMSALASAGTILFLFWTITHFARKMFVNAGEELNPQQTFTVMAAGAVGALAYNFSDSFWFSGVEGEVYALSSFFTALVFWCILKWEHADEKAGTDAVARARSDRWIVFLFFMMGLSIGVHLLNLLTIPAVVMVYYYRRYEATNRGAIFAFLIGCVITGLVQLVVIQYSMKSAGLFDVFFVNTLGMPFFSGFAIYFVIMALVVAWALRLKEHQYNRNKMILWFILFVLIFTLPFFTTTGSVGGQLVKFLLAAGVGAVAGYYFKPAGLKVLRIALWSFSFIMLGYCLYFTAIIRANARPAINMNDVSNPINLVYYLSREQYGEAPLIYGPHFMANYKQDPESPNGYAMKKGEQKYVKGKNRYIPIGTEDKVEFESEDMQIFPRVWDSSNDQQHAEFYAEWLGLDKVSDNPQRFAAPTYADNFNWFFSYQLGHMYWRYFMWNFAGKQNDIQGFGNDRDGNWISGISFIDNKRLGDQDMLPDSIKKNKAHNKLFMLPFILGIIGCVYQYLRHRKDWVVSFLLFFFTGIAVVLYLNQPGNQPRERDYAYVGSFYAFAIWIGLAVVALVKMVRSREDKTTLNNTLIYGSVLTFAITGMSCMAEPGKEALITAVFVTALYAIVTTALTYLLRAISSAGQNARVLNLATAVVCLIVPLIMAQQEWDDHDRSQKTLAPDVAKDYLESCAPNAVLFTFGDNDTYPLWYAQEVEGVRPDIRIINNSLLGIDWYINQLRYKINQADSIDVIWSPEQVEGHNREYLRFRPQGDKTSFYDLYDLMKNTLGKPNIDPDTKRDVGFGSFPITRYTVPVDTAFVRKNGTANPTDSVLSAMLCEIPQSKVNEGGLLRNDLIILNFIASNNWKRPIYFTSPYYDLGFGQYLRKDGMAYRLVPVKPSFPQSNWVTDMTMRQTGLGGTQIRADNTDFMYSNLISKFEFGGANKRGTYFDEENRRHLLNLRSLYGEAAGNMADEGRKDEAKKLLEKCEAGMMAEDMPYAMTSRYNSHNQTALIYLEAAYKAGKTDLAEKVRVDLRTDLSQQKRYYEYIKINMPELFKRFEHSEYPINEAMLEVLDAVEKKYAPQKQEPAPTEGKQSIINSVKGDTTKKDTARPK